MLKLFHWFFLYKSDTTTKYFLLLQTLLDLGASPNYKDTKGLTPLYFTLLHASDHSLTELLLHDHAFVGTCDPQGWQEVHQVCSKKKCYSANLSIVT